MGGGQNFFYLLCVCVCVWGGGVRVRFSTSPSVEKIIDPPPFNKLLVPITKSPKGHYAAYLFKDTSCFYVGVNQFLATKYS